MSPKPGRPWLVPVIIVFSLLVAWLVVTIVDRSDGTDQQTATEGTDGDGNPVDDTLATDETTDDTELEPLPPYDGWVNPASSGRMWSETVPGLITFRGNPTRTYYGSGPVPKAPKVLWSFPADGGLCGKSTDGSGTSTWCGTGWTGQPSVWPGKDGKTWVAFGAYDYGVHWLDGQTGQRLLPDFKTGDIIKGSVTVDPDGYPLALHRVTRQLLPHRRNRSRATDRALEVVGVRHPRAAVERRLGWFRARHRRLPVRGRREQLVLHLQAQPRLRRRRQGHDRPAAGVPDARLGRPTTEGHRRPPAVDRELGRDLGEHRLLRQRWWPHPGLGHQRLEGRQDARHGTSASGPATTSMPRS